MYKGSISKNKKSDALKRHKEKEKEEGIRFRSFINIKTDLNECADWFELVQDMVRWRASIQLFCHLITVTPHGDKFCKYQISRFMH
jgi:hypothetical protein